MEMGCGCLGIGGPDSLWHKFYTGWDWQPSEGFERVPAPDASTPSVASWGEGHFDIVYVNGSGSGGSNVVHKYFAGGNWGPGFEDVENLGGRDIVSVVNHCWGYQRNDLVARRHDGSYVHKAWTGSQWYPSVDDWENFGGDFASAPAVGSWGPGRLDIVGISAKTGSILHKFWFEGWSDWEDLGGGPFVGTPRITSWGPNRLDIWAVDSKDHHLNHLVWDGTRYLDWADLGGGHFEETPVAVHWDVDRIDIIGRAGDNYLAKAWDGQHWYPEDDHWGKLVAPFASEPAVLARRGTNFINVFGIDKEDQVRYKLWSGSSWEPSGRRSWSLGKLPGAKNVLDAEEHHSSQQLLSEL